MSPWILQGESLVCFKNGSERSTSKRFTSIWILTHCESCTFKCLLARARDGFTVSTGSLDSKIKIRSLQNDLLGKLRENSRSITYLFSSQFVKRQCGAQYRTGINSYHDVSNFLSSVSDSLSWKLWIYNFTPPTPNHSILKHTRPRRSGTHEHRTRAFFISTAQFIQTLSSMQFLNIFTEVCTSKK